MKPLLKVAFAKMILLAFVGSAQAVVTNINAVSFLTDASGNIAIVWVFRATDPTTHVTTSNLLYSFCYQTTAATCLEGQGNIPNEAFTGKATTDVRRGDVLKLLVDTSTVAGFTNELCLGPNNGGCDQGTSPATGGLFDLTYNKKRGDGEVTTFTDRKTVNYKVTLNAVYVYAVFSGHTQGTVLGINASTGLHLEVDTVSGKGSPAGDAIMGKSVIEHKLAAPALQRLKRLRGDKDAN
jgi:hypothetical protein